jgi:hypothetical protein
MWIVWAVSTMVTFALYVYRSSLTRDEAGQIFLDEAFAHEKAAQTAIVTRVNRLAPVIRLSVTVTVVLTVTVLAYYAWSAFKALY